ncbi:hypothetical protein [Streptomyces sp. NPDC015345]|uniref:hypothetical protein n=1 Tax=Streptomyces sp. NPDC015345 TaxID=3364953 RepID=UPI0036F4DA51
MSSLLRSAAVLSLAALALAAGVGAASAAPATAPATAPAIDHPDPEFGHHHHSPPLNFGPFQVPSNGSVSGGFAWNTH